MADGVKLGSALGSIGLDLGPLRQAAAGVRAAFGEMDRAADATRVAIVRTQEQSRLALDRLKGAINLQQRQYQILAQEVEAAAKQYGAGAIQVQRKQLAMDRLSQSLANNQARLQQVEQELKPLADRLRDAGSGAGTLVSRFEQVRESADRTAQAMAATGATLSAAITAPLALAGAQALRLAGDYEQTLSLFQANTRATEAQMARAGETAKQLGADLTLPGASAADAAEVMLELAKAGLGVNDALAEARGTMALAATEGLDNAESAEIAAAAYNTFREEGLRVAQVADLLAAGSSSSSASVRSLSQGLQQAGSSFAAAHIPLQDLVAQMSLMAQAGIQGSDAGTSLKTMLQKLQGPTDKARAEMRALGISIYDSQGAMRPMREIVEQFSSALGGLTQEQRDAAVVTIFGSDAQRAANIVLAGGVDAYDQMVAAVGRQGAASELAGARMQGLAGAIEGFTSTVETALLEAVEPFLGTLASLVNAGSALVSAFAGLPAPLRNAALAFAAVLAAAGPLLLAAGGLAAAMAAVSAPVLVAVGALAAFAGALASGNPFVIGATTAILAYLAAQQFGVIAATVPVILAQAGALAANATAALAASGPFLVLAAAVAGVTIVYQRWKNIASEAAGLALADQTTELGRSYRSATEALDRYADASAEAQSATRGQADELRDLQAEQEKDIELRAQLAEQGRAEGPEWEANTARINGRTARMRELTTALDTNLSRIAQGLPILEQQATAEERAAQATAQASAAQLAAAGDIDGALALMRQSAGLTEEAFDQLQKQLEDAAEKGAEAFGQAVQAEAGFLTERETAIAEHGARVAELRAAVAQAGTDAERTAAQEQLDEAVAGFAERERAAAESYARQQAAQLAHLGQILIDYASAQGRMAGLDEGRIAEMTRRLADEYGVQQSLTDRSFGEMTRSIDAWVAGGGRAADQYVGDMGRVRAATVEVQQEVDRQIGLLSEQAATAFAGGSLSATEYAERLRRIPGEARRIAEALLGIPTRVNSTVTITTERREVGGQGTGTGTSRAPTQSSPGASGTRALGGPVAPNRMYEVAEGGIPELLAVGGRTYLLMGGAPGRVIPAMPGAGGSFGAGDGGLTSGPLATLRDAALTLRRAGETLAAGFRGGATGEGFRQAGGLSAAGEGFRRAGDLARQAAAAGAGATPRFGDVGGGGGGGLSLTVAPVFHGAIVDNEARIKQVEGRIVDAAKQAVSQAFGKAVDLRILGGGAR